MTLHVTRDKGTVTVHVTYGPVRFQVEETEGHVLSFWHELGKIVAAEDNEKRAKAGYKRFFGALGEVAEPWAELDETAREAWITAFTE